MNVSVSLTDFIVGGGFLVVLIIIGIKVFSSSQKVTAGRDAKVQNVSGKNNKTKN